MRRLEFDAEAERSVGRLRVAGAAVVVTMSALLLSSGAGPIGWSLTIAALLVALGWAAAALRGRRRAQAADDHFLRLDDDALRMARGGEPIVVPWREVSAIEVDEERLVVWVRRGDGSRLKVEPVWRGVGLHELAALLGDAAQEHKH